MNQNKVLSYLGLAMKANRVASGEFSTEKAVKERKAKLVVIAEDASSNTKKMFQNMCTYYKVPILFFADKEILGHSVGKQVRASLAILDQGLADAIVKTIQLGGSEYGQNENI